MSSTLVPYLVLLGLLGLERLFELALSARNAARARALGGHEVGRRHFAVMAAMHTLFLFACAAEAWWLRRPFPGAWGVAALLGEIGAQGLRYWAVATLGDRWNARIIVVPGRAPVTTGPYRLVRHPNYVAVVAEIALVPLVHGCWWTALAFSLANAAVLAVRIGEEERALGPGYADHFAGTPRFVPAPRAPSPSTRG